MCVYVYRFLIVLMISVKKQVFNPILENCMGHISQSLEYETYYLFSP